MYAAREDVVAGPSSAAVVPQQQPSGSHSQVDVNVESIPTFRKQGPTNETDPSEEMYHLKTMCLAKRKVLMPSKEEHGFLLFCGLGARRWQIGVDCNSLSFKQAILSIYPRLRSVIGYNLFTLMKDKQTFEKIPEKINTPRRIRSYLGPNFTGCLIVVPVTDIVLMEERREHLRRKDINEARAPVITANLEANNARASRSFCLLCGKMEKTVGTGSFHNIRNEVISSREGDAYIGDRLNSILGFNFADHLIRQKIMKTEEVCKKCLRSIIDIVEKEESLKTAKSEIVATFYATAARFSTRNNSHQHSGGHSSALPAPESTAPSNSEAVKVPAIAGPSFSTASVAPRSETALPEGSGGLTAAAVAASAGSGHHRYGQDSGVEHGRTGHYHHRHPRDHHGQAISAGSRDGAASISSTASSHGSDHQANGLNGFAGLGAIPAGPTNLNSFNIYNLPSSYRQQLIMQSLGNSSIMDKYMQNGSLNNIGTNAGGDERASSAPAGSDKCNDVDEEGRQAGVILGGGSRSQSPHRHQQHHGGNNFISMTPPRYGHQVTPQTQAAAVSTAAAAAAYYFARTAASGMNNGLDQGPHSSACSTTSSENMANMYQYDQNGGQTGTEYSRNTHGHGRRRRSGESEYEAASEIGSSSYLSVSPTPMTVSLGINYLRNRGGGPIASGSGAKLPYRLSPYAGGSGNGHDGETESQNGSTSPSRNFDTRSYASTFSLKSSGSAAYGGQIPELYSPDEDRKPRPNYLKNEPTDNDGAGDRMDGEKLPLSQEGRCNVEPLYKCKSEAGERSSSAGSPDSIKSSLSPALSTNTSEDADNEKPKSGTLNKNDDREEDRRKPWKKRKRVINHNDSEGKSFPENKSQVKEEQAATDRNKVDVAGQELDTEPDRKGERPAGQRQAAQLKKQKRGDAQDCDGEYNEELEAAQPDESCGSSSNYEDQLDSAATSSRSPSEHN